MIQKALDKFNNDLSRNTKAFVLLAISLVSLEYIFKPLQEGYALTALIAVFLVLLAENLFIVTSKFPYAWNLIKWTVLFILIMLILIGFINA